MASKLSPALAMVSLALLAIAPAATAAGVGGQRVADPAERSAESWTAASSPLIAPTMTCPGQTDPSAPASEQERAMLCMTNFARAATGLPELAAAAELDRSAHHKGGDILRCDEFSHFACDREFTYWIRAEGYIGDGCWHAGENLAWGGGGYGSARAIFRAWMGSPSHRRNILGDYDEVGIDVVSGSLEGSSDVQVWTAHFGSRC
jgi:uncharacterized protein YkwD